MHHENIRRQKKRKNEFEDYSCVLSTPCSRILSLVRKFGSWFIDVSKTVLRAFADMSIGLIVVFIIWGITMYFFWRITE